MATVKQYQTPSGATHWEVRYRTPERGTTRKRGFKTKRDAEAHATKVENDKLTGAYVTPSKARTTVAQLGPGWLERQRGHLKPSAYRPLEVAWRVRIEPRWGRVALGDIRPSAVQAWLAGLSVGDKANKVKPVGATVVQRTHQVFQAILADAVKDRMPTESPHSAAG